MYQLRSIILSLFLISFDASALVLKIEKNDGGYIKETLSGISHRSIVSKQVYRFNVNGNYMNSLSVGQLEIEPQDQSFQISSNCGLNLNIHPEIAIRILQILRYGWSSAMNWQPASNIAQWLQSNTPPCSFVFYYLAYGITDFISSPTISPIELHAESIELAVNGNQILPYTIILIPNATNFHEKEAYLYIGNDIFLSWNHSTNQFYLMSSHDIDISHHISNPYYLQVIQVNGINHLIYQMMIFVFLIWQANQHNTK